MAMEFDFRFMDLAITQARLALNNGELPIGAVVVCNGIVVGELTTSDKKSNSRLAHAEYLLLADLEHRLKTGDKIELYTTLEPCLMCYGTAVNLGVTDIIYAMNSRTDGCTQMSSFKTVETSFVKHPNMVGPIAEKAIYELFETYLKIHSNIKNGYTNWVLQTLNL